MIARAARSLGQLTLILALTMLYLGMAGGYIYFIAYLLHSDAFVVIQIVAISCSIAMIAILFQAWSDMMDNFSRPMISEI